jgi:hypothetical protein
MAALLCLGLVGVAAPQDDAPRAARKESVEAPVLVGITIDGDLKDWPAAMPRHAIKQLHVFPPFTGTGGLAGADLSTSRDFSAAFSVGYSPKDQVIYLAVIVRDDNLVVGNTSSWDTDAVEVYVDGLHSETLMPYPVEGGWPGSLDASDVPALQYIGIPGEGRVYGIFKSAGQDRHEIENPILMFGDVKKTKTRMAFRREGQVTTYEWAIHAFDQYPDMPTKLTAGKKIGFDLAVCDKDTPAKTPLAANEPEEDRMAWICWGPRSQGHAKNLNTGNLGEIVLGHIPGAVPRPAEN